MASRRLALLLDRIAAYILAMQGGIKLADKPRSPIQIGQAYEQMLQRLTEGFLPLKFNTDFGIGATLKRISDSVPVIHREFAETMIGFQTTFRNVFGDIAKIKRLEPTGWLPHSSSPLHLLDDEIEAEELRAQVETHYRANWSEIKAGFIERIAAYDLDDEAKETFLEALDAHEASHYRSVVRLLFPEIERIACKEFYQGKLYEKPKEGESQGKQITSLTGFRETVLDLPAGDVIGFEYGMQLYEKLNDHLYSAVGSSKSRIRRCEQDPVPNRNASLHGIVSYKSFQNSMNMLIMAEYTYHLFSVMKEYLLEESDEGGPETS